MSRSARVTIPTSTPSESTTGNRRTPACVARCAASATGTSRRVTTGGVVTPEPLAATDPGDKTYTQGQAITPLQLEATGGTAPYTWAVTAGELPAGLTLAANGTLKGIPVIESNSVGMYDSDGAGTGVAAPFIALISAPNILLADDGQVMLDSSAEASISMTDDGAGSTLTSLWQRNMIGLRAERLIHWLRRRPNAVFVITDVNY